ncbi:MAG TPA: hypothetical protein PLS07_00785 [Niabella sp.]|nr:hypothetical protein [Niabella sp.]HQW14911.1 hypothetical protein [Niabella sp.]HQX18464.1 hypothetical protein [Niabella sp.]HRB05991.1 hypothetical protein [Niabella sp.]HRB36873.1 hypothetical protein [Niabella sp.]
MKRPFTINKILDKVHTVFPFDGLYQQVFGHPETSGLWLLYGMEKNGKTWFALKLSEYLSQFRKVLYVSAEEGTGSNFQQAVKRAKLHHRNSRLLFVDYLPVADIHLMLTRRHAPGVVLIDNTTVYGRELRSTDLVGLMREHKHTLFVVLAHERRGEPEGATAVMSKKLAQVIIRVQGLSAQISGRVPGGVIGVDEEKAMLYWGAQ